MTVSNVTSTVTSTGIPGLASSVIPAGGNPAVTPNGSVGTAYSPQASATSSAGFVDNYAAAAQGAGVTNANGTQSLSQASQAAAGEARNSLVNAGQQVASGNLTGALGSLSEAAEAASQIDPTNAMRSLLGIAGSAMKSARTRLQELLQKARASGDEPDAAEVASIQEDIRSAAMLFELLASTEQEKNRAIRVWLQS